METGIEGLAAPPLEHIRWIDENGDECSPLCCDPSNISLVVNTHVG